MLKKKAEPKTPHLLSLNQDTVAMTLQSEEVKGDYLDRCMKTRPKVMTITLNTYPNISRMPAPESSITKESIANVTSSKTIPDTVKKNPASMVESE
jgi:hypothetical protein